MAFKVKYKNGIIGTVHVSCEERSTLHYYMEKERIWRKKHGEEPMSEEWFRSDDYLKEVEE